MIWNKTWPLQTNEGGDRPRSDNWTFIYFESYDLTGSDTSLLFGGMVGLCVPSGEHVISGILHI